VILELDGACHLLQRTVMVTMFAPTMAVMLLQEFACIRQQIAQMAIRAQTISVLLIKVDAGTIL